MFISLFCPHVLFFLILFSPFAYSSVSFPISYSYFPSSYQPLPLSSCLCVVHCSCLCFVFLPVSNSTYCTLFLSMNLSIDCLLYLLFCFSASLTNLHLFLFFWSHHAAFGIFVPQPGIKPAYPALGGGFLTAGPPGNPWTGVAGLSCALKYT